MKKDADGNPILPSWELSPEELKKLNAERKARARNSTKTGGNNAKGKDAGSDDGKKESKSR